MKVTLLLGSRNSGVPTVVLSISLRLSNEDDFACIDYCPLPCGCATISPNAPSPIKSIPPSPDALDTTGFQHAIPGTDLFSNTRSFHSGVMFCNRSTRTLGSFRHLSYSNFRVYIGNGAGYRHQSLAGIRERPRTRKALAIRHPTS